MNHFYYRLLSYKLWLMLHVAYWRIQKGDLQMEDGYMIQDETFEIEPAELIKPGVKTSEFYMTPILALLGVLVSFGLLTTPLADQVATAIMAAVPAALGLIGAVQAAVKYIQGRVSLKTAVALKR